MPEGPELYMSSVFVNNVCRNRVFGRASKSEISKNPPITPPAEKFTITAAARGKEIKLILKPFNNSSKSDESLQVLFTFGLAGKFEFYPATELKKHAHMNFFTDDDGEEMVLSFNDYMRFGKWSPGVDFSYKQRGPCVLHDYQSFRDNVLKDTQVNAFNKPICEVLLNQKYFNGIGNYLRAEILYRARIPPFVSARSVLEPLACEGSIKSETPDLLQLCTILPQEVVHLEGSWYDGQDREDSGNAFNNWLQCYYQDGMKNISDHNKRTVWYSGPLGPLAPKDGKTRAKKKSKSKKSTSSEIDDTSSDGDNIKKETVSSMKAKKKSTKKDVKSSVNKSVANGRVTRSKVAKNEKMTSVKMSSKKRQKRKTTKKLNTPDDSQSDFDNKTSVKKVKLNTVKSEFDDKTSVKKVKLESVKCECDDTGAGMSRRVKHVPLTNGAQYLNSSKQITKGRLATPKHARQSRSKR